MSNLKKHNYGSFSYKTINQDIQKILRERSRVGNTVQIGMPFVKATATVEIPEILGANNKGFTLGIQVLPDIAYESLFSATNRTNAEDPLIGYTYQANGQNKLVYATVTDNEGTLITKYLKDSKSIQNINGKFARIPPPGITNLKIGRNRSGLSVSADLSISVPTLQQLEYLHRVFLIPGCGMVVEWGQQFASDKEDSFGERGLSGALREAMFPWYDRAKLDDTLQRLGARSFGLEEILKKYVYPTQGQYMWMFGRVSNISTKGNADGSFDVTVTLKGPSEDQWAYSTRQTVMPQLNQENKLCADGTNSVETYLTQTTAGGYNLKTLLDGVIGGTILTEWKDHVIQIPSETPAEGAAGAQATPTTNQSSFADSSNAYFMTWRFFVNVVLNGTSAGPTGGIKGIYERAGLDQKTLSKIRFIRPYAGSPTQVPLADDYENYVGNNPNLRSTDGGTCIIVNETAATEAQAEYTAAGISAQDLVNKMTQNEITQKFGGIGGAGLFDFQKSVSGETDKGFLSTGVWLNHKAVISSLAGASTVLQGVSNLLTKMNSATRGYWSLTLDPLEAITENDVADYIVVDQNYKGSAREAVADLKENIYTFNKLLRNTSSGVVGSELLDFSVDMDLPKLLFSQIATMGLSQAGDQSEAEPTAAGISPCQNGTISDPNDTLRKLFGITTISPKRGNVSVDITNRSEPRQIGACSAPATLPTVGGAFGNGVAAAPPAVPDNASADLKARVENLQNLQKAWDTNCANCNGCFGTDNQTIGYGGTNLRAGPPLPASAADQVGHDAQPFKVSNGLLQESPPPSNPYGRPTVALGRNLMSPTNKYYERNKDTEFHAVYYQDKKTGQILSAPMPKARTLNFGSFKGKGLEAGRIPLNQLTQVRTVDESSVRVNDYLEPIAAAWFQRFLTYVKNNPTEKAALAKALADTRAMIPGNDTAKNKIIRQGQTYFIASSLYRDSASQIQVFVGRNGDGAAFPGSSLHNRGCAVDFAELFYLAGGSTRKANNDFCRSTPLYQWQNRVLPAFGFVNPWYFKRSGSECWHFEFRGYDELTGTEKILPSGVPPLPSGQPASPPAGAPAAAPQSAGDLTSCIQRSQAQGLIVANSTELQNKITDPALISNNTGMRTSVPKNQLFYELAKREPPPPPRGGDAGGLNTRAQIGAAYCNSPVVFSECKAIADAISQQNATAAAQSTIENAVSSATQGFSNLNVLLRYLELMPDNMVAKIRCNADGNKANAFGASPGTLSIKVDMTLPGIAGLRVGELFWIDQLPAYYKIFGAFQVMGIEDTIGVDGWQTKVHAVFNFLGNQWKNTMLDIVGIRGTSDQDLVLEAVTGE